MHRNQTKIKSCETSGDYTYVTYNNDDEKMAQPQLARFKNLGFEIFYNEGLENPKSEIEELREQIENSALFVPFLTQSILNSNLTCSEIYTASAYRIPIISIYLEEVQLSDGLEYAIGRNPCITQYSLSDDEFETKLLDELNRLSREVERKKDKKQNPARQLFRGREQESMQVETDRQASISVPGLIGIYSNLKALIKVKLSSLIHSGDETGEDMPSNKEHPKEESFYLGGPDPMKDYFHMSYSHGDIAEIFEDLAMFDKLGINTKYDSEISTGNDYTNEIVSSIEKSRGVLFYLSEKSLQSPWNFRELEHAFRNNIPILFICLDDKLPEDPKILFFMNNNPVIFRYELTKEEYISEIRKHIRF